MTIDTDPWYPVVDDEDSHAIHTGVSTLLRLMAMAPHEEIKELAVDLYAAAEESEGVELKYYAEARRRWAEALIAKANS